jgi:hypothetical protein
MPKKKNLPVLKNVLVTRDCIQHWRCMDGFTRVGVDNGLRSRWAQNVPLLDDSVCSQNAPEQLVRALRAKCNRGWFESCQVLELLFAESQDGGGRRSPG